MEGVRHQEILFQSSNDKTVDSVTNIHINKKQRTDFDDLHVYEVINANETRVFGGDLAADVIDQITKDHHCEQSANHSIREPPSHQPISTDNPTISMCTFESKVLQDAFLSIINNISKSGSGSINITVNLGTPRNT